MPEDKNVADGDRIKELLAQLRATMDLDEASSAPEAEETSDESGYAATLDELLAGEEENEAALPHELNWEAENEAEEAENTEEISETTEEYEDEEAEEVFEEAILSTAEEKHAIENEKGNKTGDQVADILSSFFTIDTSGRHGQVTISDAFLDEQDAETETVEAEGAEEGDVSPDEAKAEEEELLFRPGEGVALSFDEKVDIVSPSAILLPPPEEEEEAQSFVSEGRFESDEKQAVEENDEDEEPFSVLPIIENNTISFADRVSLPAWGEVSTEETDGETQGALAEQEANLPAETPVINEVAEEATVALHTEEDMEELGEETLSAQGTSFAMDVDADALAVEETAASLEEETVALEDGSSPPDDIGTSGSVSLSEEPLPYLPNDSAGRSMVFELVEAENDEEEAILAPTPILDPPAAPVTQSDAQAVCEAENLPTDEPTAEEDCAKASQEAQEETAHHSPRIQLAPPAYRANREKEKTAEKDKNDQGDEDSEDFMSGIPGVMRHFLEDFPFGRTNRVQSVAKDGTVKSAPETKSVKKKKKKKHFFVEEEREYCDLADSELVRDRLQKDLHTTRMRFVVVSVFALLLLVLENLPFFLDRDLLDVNKTGYAEAFLLFGAALAAYPCLHMGACGIKHRFFLPETILLVQWVLSFLYAFSFAALEIAVPHFSFVCVLGLGVSLFFHMIWRENRLTCFEQLNVTGDKLVFSPVPKKAMKVERRAMGRGAEGDALNMYRVRKTAFVDDFSYRTSIVCEDTVSNFVSLLVFLVATVIAFAITLALTKDIGKGFGAFALALAVVPPVAMCAIHVYPMNRALRVAGAGSTILGEETVQEAVSLDAVAFEDIEAIAAKDVNVTFVRIYENPTFVLSCLNAVFRTVGGPLAGYFASADQTKDAMQRTVKLEEAASGGFTAIVDGMQFHIGIGEYMERKKTLPTFDAKDAKAQSERQAVLYVAMNGNVCAKFYIRYRVSPAFERNVRRLSKLGITSLMRTYDPCLSDGFLAKISSLKEEKVRVINKTPEQRADFAAAHAQGGIVTSGHSGKLLQLLFLCFGVNRATSAGRIYKLALFGIGAVLAVVSACFGGLWGLPSAVVALYQILWLFLNVMYVRCRIRIPKTTEGKRNETSRSLRSPKGGH